MDQKKTPFFSIIIPCLNEEHFIPHLLADLQNQTFQNFEVIVVDGKSEDKTRDKIKLFPNFQLIVSPRRNVSLQRNIGAEKARGLYLLFLDADSRIPQDFLEHTRTNVSNKPVEIFSHKILIPHNGFFDKLAIWFGNVFLDFLSHINKPRFAGACLGCKRDIFMAVKGYDEFLPMAEDHDLVSRIKVIGASHSFFNHPRYSFSMRHFHRDGYLQIGSQWCLSFILEIFNLKSIALKMKYQMGGINYSLDETPKERI